MSEFRERSDSRLRTEQMDFPPNSRLFIVCGKNTSEEEFREAFSQYGEIQDVWIVKDRKTNEHKGVTYIKYAKTSEAALAMEEMNGKPFGSSTKPLKVLIASNRHEGNKKDTNEEERLVRLFVVIPRTWTDTDLRNAFSDYGDIDYVNVVKDKKTGDSKGLGYVKFEKASQAALALENCDKTFKAVFAEPRGSQPKDKFGFDGSFRTNGSSSFGGAGRLGGGGGGVYGGGGRVMDNGFNMGMPPASGCKVQVMVGPNVRQDQIERIVDLVPNMEQCEMQRGGVLLVTYATPQWASYAVKKLHGLEYPLGSRLMCRFAEEERGRYGRGSGDQQGYPPQGGGDATMDPSNVMQSISQALSMLSASQQTGSYGTDYNSQLGTLQTMLSQATDLLQQYGYSQPANPQPTSTPLAQGYQMPMEQMGAVMDSSQYTRAVQCTVELPEPKAVLAQGSECAARLFIVCNPKPLSDAELTNVFCRFGNLIDVYMLPAKNFGYARFGDDRSAKLAIDTLHLQEVNGVRMKVMEAEPHPRQRDDSSNARKRLRI